MVWAGEDGSWRTLHAEYCRPGGQNFEIWQARAAFPLATVESLPGDIQFALHYQVAGRDYWTPPDRQGWTINADSGIRMGDGLPLLNVDFQPRLQPRREFYQITAAVCQNLRPEGVSVRWSTDRWRMFTDTPAFFRHKYWQHAIGSNARNPNRYGSAMWISQLHVGDAYQVNTPSAANAGPPILGQQWRPELPGPPRAAENHDAEPALLPGSAQEEKFAQIAKAIQDLRIDVICLQEVGEPWNDGRGDWNGNAAKIIRDRLGEPYVVCADWSHLGLADIAKASPS